MKSDLYCLHALNKAPKIHMVQCFALNIHEMTLLCHNYVCPMHFEAGILMRGGNHGNTFVLKMADNNDLTDFELKCCIIEGIKEQHVHIYDKAYADHFNRAKCEASFNE